MPSGASVDELQAVSVDCRVGLMGIALLDLL